MGLCVEVVPGETERGLPEGPAEGETVAVTWANARQVWQMIHPWGFGIGDIYKSISRCMSFHFIAYISGFSF